MSDKIDKQIDKATDKARVVAEETGDAIKSAGDKIKKLMH
jgi:hypothetical protein